MLVCFFPTSGFWSGNLLLTAPFPDLYLLVLLIVPSRYFCGGSFCFMSWCLKFFCAVGALCMFLYFLVKLR